MIEKESSLMTCIQGIYVRRGVRMKTDPSSLQLGSLNVGVCSNLKEDLYLFGVKQHIRCVKMSTAALLEI